MNRTEAGNLLKELVEKNLIQLSFYSLNVNDQGTYDLIVNEGGNFELLRTFLLEKKLVLYEDKDKGTYRIHKLRPEKTR